MGKLWLTYAWNDNADQDVDHIIYELRQAGLEISFDRVELLAGHRLWQQIDAAMNDPSVDAWAMLVTENSLRSEPCQEEIAYALDRALRSGRAGFPLIGVFPKPLDREIIPSALATRLYVNLTAPDWKEQIIKGVNKAKRAPSEPPPLPFGFTVHHRSDGIALEVWPKAGRWYPFRAAVPLEEAAVLHNVMYGPRGAVTGTGTIHTSGPQANETERFVEIYHAIDANNSGHIFLRSAPSYVAFGEPSGWIYQLSSEWMR